MKKIGKSSNGAENKPHIIVWNHPIARLTTSSAIITSSCSYSKTMNCAEWYLAAWNSHSEDMHLTITSDPEELLLKYMEKANKQGVVALDPYYFARVDTRECIKASQKSHDFQGVIIVEQKLQELLAELLLPECPARFHECFKEISRHTMDPMKDMPVMKIIDDVNKWMEDNFGLTPPPKLIELIANATNGDEDKVNPNKETMPDGQPIH